MILKIAAQAGVKTSMISESQKLLKLFCLAFWKETVIVLNPWPLLRPITLPIHEVLKTSSPAMSIQNASYCKCWVIVKDMVVGCRGGGGGLVGGQMELWVTSLICET